ncbi:MAG TPA: hypothetical protein VHT21_08165 [Stellaceae bacterium]|nr:hypothetical protein [Stellaceae bacterium]
MKRFFLVCSLVAIAACAQQAPPPPVAANPPPPPPPPPPPMTYTVYFDYNSGQLTPAAREVVRFAADGYKARSPSSVQVTLRRANAVAAELQNDGVPQSALVVSAQGESSNEPTPGQDRRVDVTVGGSPPTS